MVSLRANSIPIDIILPYFVTGTLPTGFVHECALFGKYPKGAPAGCNPGGCVGGNAHSESSAGLCHGHTASAANHTHNQSTVVGSLSNSSLAGPSDYASANHSHPGTTGSGSPTVTICNNTYPHTHASIDLQPPFRTMRFIKYTESSLPMRRKVIPNDISVYSNNVTPSENWIVNTTLVGQKFHKAVAGSCSGIGCLGGTSTHQHAIDGAHSHTANFASHGHGVGSLPTSNQGSGQINQPNNPRSRGNFPHSHTAASLAITAASGGITVDSSTHQHDAQNNSPSSIEFNTLTKSSHSLRDQGLKEGHIGLWLGTLATIPVTTQLADGTNGTVDTRDKYQKEVTAVCSCPGSTTGTLNHTHSSVTHVHTGNAAHTHPTSGVSSAGNTDNTPCPKSNSNVSATIAAGHTHAINVNSGAVPLSGVSGADSHGHGSVSLLPDSKEVAFIQKIYP